MSGITFIKRYKEAEFILTSMGVPLSGMKHRGRNTFTQFLFKLNILMLRVNQEFYIVQNRTK